MSETTVRLTATIKRGPHGLWYVRATGNGYPIEYALVDSAQSERWLSALVEDGFEIVDPLHYCEMYGIFDEQTSVAEMDADSAGYPGYGARIGRLPGDNGRGLGDDELVF